MVLHKYINLKDFDSLRFIISTNQKLTNSKKDFKKFTKKNTYSKIFIQKYGAYKGYIPTSLNNIIIDEGVFKGELTTKKNTKTTNIYSEWKKINHIIKNPKILVYKNKKDFSISVDTDSLIYLKNCSNVRIVAQVTSFLNVITENCNGSLIIISNIKKNTKEVKKNTKCPKKNCPKIVCPEKICPKPNNIYYNIVLGILVLIIFCLIIYNILIKCKN